MEGAEARERKRDRVRRYARRVVPVPLSVRTGDLPKRAASAAVMLAVAGGALWAGGAVLDALILLAALVCFGEFTRLVWRATHRLWARALGLAGGALYIGYAASLLLRIDDVALILLIVGAVICVDTFAYFFGRTIGGPKIAPRISPSKTWAGLGGGVVGATLTLALFYWFAVATTDAPDVRSTIMAFNLFVGGAAVAGVAQAGDFFESWLKRKAHMKDSSNLIPGHGGVFDRVDGLLPVVILIGALVPGVA